MKKVVFAINDFAKPRHSWKEKSIRSSVLESGITMSVGNNKRAKEKVDHDYPWQVKNICTLNYTSYR